MLSLPQPPHVAVLVRVETVGVIAAVLDVIKPAAVNGRGGVSRPGAEESVHLRPVSVEVAAALRAHCASAAAAAGGGTAAAAAAGEAKRKSRSALCVGRLNEEDPLPTLFPPSTPTTSSPRVHPRSAAQGAPHVTVWWIDRQCSGRVRDPPPPPPAVRS